MSERMKGTVYVFICVALWALIPVVAKTGQTNLNNHQFLFWSSLVSFIVLISAAAFMKTVSGIKKYTIKDWGYLISLGLLGTYIYYLFLYLGYAQATGMEVLVVQYTWPIIMVIFSIFILRERLTYRKAIAIFLGFIGVITVLTKGKFQNIDIDNFAVISLVASGAACFALFSVLSKNVKFEPLGVTSIYFLSASIASLFSMLFFSEFSIPSATEIAPVILNGTFVNGISYVFWIKALKSAEASYLAPFVFVTPILSAIYLIAFFDEPMIIAYGIGLACVVGGGFINSLGYKNMAA